MEEAVGGVEGIVGAARGRSANKSTDGVRDRIIVALDLPDAAQALEMARSLVGTVGWVKVGMTLFYAEGPRSCASSGHLASRCSWT